MCDSECCNQLCMTHLRKHVNTCDIGKRFIIMQGSTFAEVFGKIVSISQNLYWVFITNRALDSFVWKCQSIKQRNLKSSGHVLYVASNITFSFSFFQQLKWTKVLYLKKHFVIVNLQVTFVVMACIHQSNSYVLFPKWDVMPMSSFRFAWIQKQGWFLLQASQIWKVFRRLASFFWLCANQNSCCMCNYLDVINASFDPYDKP
jgi:hypothetical protein